MKKHAFLCRGMVSAILLGLFFTACGCKEKPEEKLGDDGSAVVVGQPGNLPEDGQEIDIPDVERDFPEPMVTSSGPGEKAHDYKIGLDVDERIVLTHKGYVTVWIRPKNKVPELREGKVRDTVTISSHEMKEYARISLFAPEFTVEPSEPKVTHISSDGASAVFSVTPEKEGSAEISATVELFNNEDLQGVADIITGSVEVTVYVDKVEVRKNFFRELLDMTKKQFVPFYGALLAILFGLALYLIRKFLKKKTGFDENENANGEEAEQE